MSKLLILRKGKDESLKRFHPRYSTAMADSLLLVIGRLAVLPFAY